MVGGREQNATGGPWLWVRSKIALQESLCCPGEPSGDSLHLDEDVVGIKLQWFDPVCLNDGPANFSQPAVCEADLVRHDEL